MISFWKSWIKYDLFLKKKKIKIMFVFENSFAKRTINTLYQSNGPEFEPWLCNLAIISIKYFMC
jgi:hypothetical protein